MNEIKPFYGWRYNTEKVSLEDVLAPPYDVVSAEEQENYLKKSPYNIFHLELGEIFSSDNQNENRYTRAKEFWNRWRQEGILVREKKPSIYLYNLHFEWEGRRITRKGFISLVRLAPWETKKILPHEKTFDKVTEDRLKLLKATQAQFSQIFCLYHDKNLVSLNALEEKAKLLYQVKDPQGFTHELLQVTDKEALELVQQTIEKGPLYIADGHHRYTTALRFMKEMEEKYGANPPRCFHYMMMYLCPFEEPGLLVLPTHRLLTLSLSLEEIKQKLESWGKISELTLSPNKLNAYISELKPYEFVIVNNGNLFIFKLEKEKIDKAKEIFPPSVAKLPVALFTWVIKEALKIDEAALKVQGKARFIPWVPEILDKAKGNIFGFLLAPTPVLALEEVSQAGTVMPHKSTYFHPKILTGTVLFEISPEKGPPC
ncbi:Uncharacterized conserved protein UCP033563 [Thermodesulfatator indicus DSM 15286]|uniref:Uncharacterized conserved protein UCP033563 n=1 Tax=Thermodesulfatator indicus (strain DSM 15286 / JCM 11887 / CIR29812) TaxID=667014 RepID=F8AD66_THEID|nr:DUF1015 domain-containing protein [Thermodesulfatator indicus]AEH44798.1 Uncharacterized conserved protein UCP033563 [Thermodesulfatator indicus DSM 15286]